MTATVYFTAKELQERWNLSASTFRKMRLADNLPVASVLNDASVYHIDNILAFEKEMETAP